MTMKPFTTVSGAAAPLLLPDVDTDTISPAHSGRRDPAASVFAPLRYRADGTDDPDFVLNRPAFRGAPILLCGANFGCGSSRETAVWSLAAIGVRCLVAPSFGDIFAGNCFQNGMLPIVLDAATIERIAAVAADGSTVVVDLESQTIVTAGGVRVEFTVDALRRAQLLAGLDDIALTLTRHDEIVAFQTVDRGRRPWIYETNP